MGDADCGDAELALQGLSVNDDVLTQHVESSDSTALALRPNYGRVLLAAQEANFGEVLFRESPVLVWKNDNWLDYLSNFHSLPEESRSAVLDLFHPPLDSPTMRVLRDSSILLSSAFPTLDPATIHKLLAIANTNAHSYVGTDVGNEYQEIVPGVTHDGDSKKAALFLYGSKVAHCCTPNTSYTSRTPDGKLEYKVVSPTIEEGEMLSFSYLALESLAHTPTHIRREQLFQSKTFVCKCDRCLGPDYARQIRCFNKSKELRCGKFMTCQHDGSSETNLPVWTCGECGIMPETTHKLVLEKEATVQHLITKTENRVMFNCMSAPVSDIEELFQASVFGGRGPAADLRLAGARMGLAIASACECIAAGCDGTTCGRIVAFAETENPASSPHAAIYGNGQAIFHACQDLLQWSSLGGRKATWPSFAMATIERYLPILRIYFGQDDADVREIANAVALMRKKVAREGKRTNKTSNKKKKGRKRS
ncbi:MAG: hypothetical protein SGARI_000997 [Bacillariaceae sp.]